MDEIEEIMKKNFRVSELGQIRYLIEHQMIRDTFFKQPKAFMGMLLAENGLYGYYNAALDKLGKPGLYTDKEFGLSATKFDGDNILIMTELPTPEYVPLCYRMYFVCDSSFTKPRLFTLERGYSSNFLCEWDGEKNHINHGETEYGAFDGEDKEAKKAVEGNVIIKLYKGEDPRS